MKNILEISNLSKQIKRKKILDNVSFSVDKGQIVGLVGPNGAGKTTIMKAILSLINPDKGKIKLNGKEISYHNHSDLKKVGALIENPSIYPFLSGFDHLKMYSHNKNIANINQIINDLHMKKYINKKVKYYSLGMKQKIGIAITLLNNPDLVILDEPMNGLDPKSNRDLRQLIIDLAHKGTSFLISSHIISELEKIIDQVVLINQGKIIENISLQELKNNGNNYLVLNTNDNNRSIKLLDSNNIQSQKYFKEIRIRLNHYDDIQNTLKLLISNDIQILNIQKLSEDLEDTLFNTIYK